MTGNWWRLKPKKYTEMLNGLRNFVVRPEFFIFTGLAFLVLGTAATLDPFIRNLNPLVSVSPMTFLVFLFGLLCFYLGLRTHKAALRLKYAPLAASVPLGTAAAYYILNLNLPAALLLSLFALVMSYILLFSNIRFSHLFISGAFLFWLNFLLNGIPLFDIGMHGELFRMINPLFILGFFFMLYSAARLYPKHRYLWAFLVFSAFLSTYRIYAGVAFMTWVLLELRNSSLPGKISKKIPIVVLGVLAFSVLFIYLGHSIMAGSYGSWVLDPIRTLEYRLAFTMNVFDDIVRLSFPAGYTFGSSLTMEATEFTCRTIYGCTGRITSTAFGEAMLDFGLPGIFLVSWWVGAVLGNLFRHDYPLYTILFSMLLAVIDVGINIFVLLGYIYLGWMGLVSKWKK